MGPEGGRWWERYERYVDQVVDGVVAAHLGRVEREELRQCAMLALVEAWQRYEPERADTFDAYLRVRIRGAVQDAARRESQRKERHQLASGVARREGRTGRDRPRGPDEAAPRLQPVTLSALERVASAEGSSRVARAWSGARGSIESEVMYRDFVRGLRERLDALEARERAAVELCDLEGLTFAEAAERLALSPAGVFRIRKRAIARLRGELAPAGERSEE